MLRKAKELEQFELRARDGRIGQVGDFFFDDQHWTVRYLVVDTGAPLASREVLISPVAVSRVDWQAQVLPLNLTQDQVRQSPRIDTEQPVSREHEAALLQYYNLPVYWGVSGFPEMGIPMPTTPFLPPSALLTPGEKGDAPLAVHEDHHLRSVQAVTDYFIEARDGTIGHVDDFLIEDREWNIRYLVVETRNWWPGKKVLIAPQWISRVGWDDTKVHVALTRAAIKSSPAYDPAAPLTPDYAGLLDAHYLQAREPQA